MQIQKPRRARANRVNRAANFFPEDFRHEGFLGCRWNRLPEKRHLKVLATSCGAAIVQQNLYQRS
jgi:hypothetical protein